MYFVLIFNLFKDVWELQIVKQQAMVAQLTQRGPDHFPRFRGSAMVAQLTGEGRTTLRDATAAPR